MSKFVALFQFICVSRRIENKLIVINLLINYKCIYTFNNLFTILLRSVRLSNDFVMTGDDTDFDH